ncbi:MAG: GntR family transcriptional regulator [Lachnospiraceae bacterium]|nr:GntR family transcriptional regulator [Lachnospiraceae bacterium]
MESTSKLAVSRKTLHEQLADILREKILRAEILPGEKINEKEIAHRYQVSRGPVREALRQIEEEGLVTYASQKGCVVKAMTYEEMSEAYLLRSTLECLAVKIFDGKMSQEGLIKLQQAIDDIEENAKKKELYEIISADERFHSAIVEESGCDRLYKMWKSLQGSNTATYYTMKSEDLMPYDVLGRNHQYILDLFRKQMDVDTIVREIDLHYSVVPQTLYQATNKGKIPPK